MSAGFAVLAELAAKFLLPILITLSGTGCKFVDKYNLSRIH